MTMAIITFSYFLLLLLTLALSDVGVNYGRIANNLPPPEEVVQLLKSKGINKVKIYDVDRQVLKAFASSGISLIVCMRNELLQQASRDQRFVDKWVSDNIVKNLPKTKIEGIAVGNEIIDDPKTLPFLVEAMKNVYDALVKSKLDSTVKVSSPVSSSCFNASYPPSAGKFKPELIETVLKPMLDLIRKSGSYFSINLYPFFAYKANPKEINLDYALMNPNDGVFDNVSQIKYPNMIEAQIDATYAALAAIGFNDVKLVVTESGWPSAGGKKEIGANKKNAAAFNGNLWKRFKGGVGTPKRPQDSITVYIFALFNENQKPGLRSERNYGLLYPDKHGVVRHAVQKLVPIQSSINFEVIQMGSIKSFDSFIC
ncbi:glucan endo-1,3-beta-glucosidase 14-like [Pistacia vera]|uniref:glucan endo-1,3-beta-glucosidase 14-like n=1 Tax=Pistacia vera TaxID=55513 RepID=UPI001262CC79|nr:glucan endo-1,3-beta-glucosidase 14-like [Pistacia vera]